MAEDPVLAPLCTWLHGSLATSFSCSAGKWGKVPLVGCWCRMGWAEWGINLRALQTGVRADQSWYNWGQPGTCPSHQDLANSLTDWQGTEAQHEWNSPKAPLRHWRDWDESPYVCHLWAQSSIRKLWACSWPSLGFPSNYLHLVWEDSPGLMGQWWSSCQPLNLEVWLWNEEK